MEKIKELCVENCQNIEAGILAGASRIELCDNLAEGGTTVSFGVMKQAIALGEKYQVPVFPIIRPRGGNFVFSQEEVMIMEDDIKIARNLGAKGVVIGALTVDKQIDQEAMARLLAHRGEMMITFHMAFDVISSENQPAAIEWLIEHRVERILTHGGDGNQSIFEYLELINRNQEISRSRLSFVLGGGVTAANLEKLANLTQGHEFHGTKIVKGL